MRRRPIHCIGFGSVGHANTAKGKFSGGIKDCRRLQSIPAIIHECNIDVFLGVHHGQIDRRTIGGAGEIGCRLVTLANAEVLCFTHVLVALNICPTACLEFYSPFPAFQIVEGYVLKGIAIGIVSDLLRSPVDNNTSVARSGKSEFGKGIKD